VYHYHQDLNNQFLVTYFPKQHYLISLVTRNVIMMAKIYIDCVITGGYPVKYREELKYLVTSKSLQPYQTKCYMYVTQKYFIVYYV